MPGASWWTCDTCGRTLLVEQGPLTCSVCGGSLRLATEAEVDAKTRRTYALKSEATYDP